MEAATKPGAMRTDPIRREGRIRRLTTETKQAFKTTEFWAMVAIVVVQLIDKTPLYELVAICWEVGQMSSIHNHREQNCWMAVPIGRLLVQNYRTLAEDINGGTCKIVPSDIEEINAAQCCAVNPAEPVHASPTS